MIRKRFALTMMVGSLLLAGGGYLLGAGQPPNPLDPQHFIAQHRCADCHTTHKAPGANMMKDRVLENICRRCHSASQILDWQTSGVLGDPAERTLPPAISEPVRPFSRLPSPFLPPPR